MKSYRCFYLMKGSASDAQASFVQFKSTDAKRAAQIARMVTGCETVTDVVRLED